MMVCKLIADSSVEADFKLPASSANPEEIERLRATSACEMSVNSVLVLHFHRDK